MRVVDYIHKKKCLSEISILCYPVKTVLLILFLSVDLPIFSQEDNSFQIQNITVKDGLSQNTVKCMAQDSRGFMWLGTLNGLNRYDGNEFMVLVPKYGNAVSLSDNRIRTIQEDKSGYIWLQTNINNVSCYNTQSEHFVDYHPFSTNHKEITFSKNGDVWLWGNTSGCLQIIHKKNKLEANYFGKELLGSMAVNFLFESSDSSIWIGTKNKLLRFRNNVLKAIAEDDNYYSAVESENAICIFTLGNKILLFDKKSLSLKKNIQFLPANKPFKIHNMAPLSSNIILITSETETYTLNTKSLKTDHAAPYFQNKAIKNAYITYDNLGNLWIYNKSGSIWQFNNTRTTFAEIPLIPPSILSFIDLERYSIYHDSRDIIWITTYGNGLFAINRKTGKTMHLTHEKDQATGLPTNFLLSIAEDNSGEIWVGTEYAGISKISLILNKNKIFYPEGEDTKQGDKTIRLIYEDQKENIWLGTKNGNLYVYDNCFNKLIKHDIYGGMPYALAEDTAGNKWVGTKGKGLLIFKQGEYNTFQVFKIPSMTNSLQSNNSLYAICKDSKGRMWLATFGDGLFLAQRDHNKLTFKGFPEISRVQSRMRTIIQDKNGLIWIGGNNGVVTFNPDELIKDGSQFINFRFDSKNSRSLNNNEVKVIFEDSRGMIWMGTSGGGLNLVMKDENIRDSWFKHFTSEEGLINNIVQAIQEDDEGNLWISTENGISKFNFVTARFENYNFSDNWEANLFCESASCKRKNGDILFGSYNGMYTMKPGNMTSPVFSPPVVLTRIKINGNDVFPGDKDSPLTEATYTTRKIRLRYDQNSFNIQFALLNFRNPAANSFTYILEGYEKTWNPITRHNFAAYRNIPSGTYTFKVKGCNSLGVWNNNETTLDITVVPPAWRSPLALFVYFILLSAGGFIATKTIMKINNLNTTVKIEQQLTEFKLRFFTNISHEFRIPLTIIQGTIENLIAEKNLPVKAVKQIRFLEKSSLRLLRLINQLLEFRQIQNSKMELTLEDTDVISFFKDIFDSFNELATKKKIAYKFHSTHKSHNILIDRNKMDKVIYNLLSNAFKFTPKNGKIDFAITIDQQKKQLKLSVSDSGIGIPKDKQAFLFVRFKQINPSSTGTGIGLHLASELVKVHRGTISYTESAYKGANFVVTIPLSYEAYKVTEPISTHEQKHKIANFEIPISQEKDILAQIEPQTYKNCKLLIIEDDLEICNFLNDQLSTYFKVSVAHDGVPGLKKAVEEQPDLIICDVMMPEMNGFEVTQRLKSEFNTCHIPVIMLTAYASLDHQVEGIESGADSYITKPFSTRYLITRIIKLIEQREKLQHKFSIVPGLAQMPEFTANKENEFIRLIHEKVEKNIENTEFSMDDFALSVSMGRTAFYKKVKGLTGYTPNEYLRVIRMKKAADLLLSTNLNVSEIAYKVGINNPFYFTKCFKKQFGTTPSSFAKKGANK
jgi:signal transduction histidine kinase/ligand-binding sensor domain-containing protein/DNA-binding response OmpR family regulator